MKGYGTRTAPHWTLSVSRNFHFELPIEAAQAPGLRKRKPRPFLSHSPFFRILLTPSAPPWHSTGISAHYHSQTSWFVKPRVGTRFGSKGLSTATQRVRSAAR